MSSSVSTSSGLRDKPAYVAEMGRGLRAALPVMLGFVPFALVLGAQAAQKGLSLFEVPMMTGMNFGGGSEFAAIHLWSSPPHIALIVAMSFLVNSRHILMGAAFEPYIRRLPRRRAFFALFFMCDESWAMSLADARARSATHISVPYYAGICMGLYLTWISMTTLGAAVGPTIGNVEQYGFDMAFTAVFLVLLRGMWKGMRASRPWFVSLVVAAATHLAVPGAWYVAAGACAGLIAALVFLMGVTIRHFFNTSHAGKAKPWWTWAATVALFLGIVWLSSLGTQRLEGEADLTAREARLTADPHFEAVRDIVAGRCSMCHASEPVWDGVGVPPKGVMLETPQQIREHASAIYVQAAVTHAMPPGGNITEISDEDRATIAAWYESGAKAQ